MAEETTGNNLESIASSALDELEGLKDDTNQDTDNWDKLLTYRIEFWTDTGKDGRERVYWQWCKRGSGKGKRGGKRFRFYGGTYESLSKREDAAYWQNRYWQNKGRGGKGRKVKGNAKRIDTGNAG